MFVLVHDYYILHLLTCMDASLKNVRTVNLTYIAYHLQSEKQTIPYVKISNLHRSNQTPLKYSYCSQLANHLNPPTP